MSKLSASAAVFVPPKNSMVGFVPTKPQTPDEQMPGSSSPLQRRELQKHQESCQSTIHELSDTINRLQVELEKEKKKNIFRNFSVHQEERIKKQDGKIKKMRMTIGNHYEEIQELTRVNSRLSEKNKDQQKSIDKLLRDIDEIDTEKLDYKKKYLDLRSAYDDLRKDYNDYRLEEFNKRARCVEEITQLKEKLRDNDLWMKNTLRLKWIIDQMEKVGAIRLPDHEWAIDMARDVEFDQEDPLVSTFREKIPYSIYREFLPNASDAGIRFMNEEDENRLIENLSREAREFTSQLGSGFNDLIVEDRDRAMKIATNLQAIFRGAGCRRRLNRIFGTNTTERSTRINSAVLIQKIFRGFKSRGHMKFTSSSRFIRDNLVARPHCQEMTNIPWKHRVEYWTMNQIYRRSLVFYNTRETDDRYSYAWYNQSSGIRSSWKPINSSAIQSSQGIATVPGTRVSTFVGHLFEVHNHTKQESFWIRINFSTPNKMFIDINTGISVHVNHFVDLYNRLIGGQMDQDDIPEQNQDRSMHRISSAIDDTESRDIQTRDNGFITIDGVRRCNCLRCQQRRQEENDDEARLQMAIQLSIESAIQRPQNTIRWTDDAEDYNISNMFQEHDENTLIRQRQDQEYARAEEIDLANQRLAEDVDTQAVRDARLARFNQ